MPPREKRLSVSNGWRISPEDYRESTPARAVDRMLAFMKRAFHSAVKLVLEPPWGS
jgi:hypothetical protein